MKSRNILFFLALPILLIACQSQVESSLQSERQAIVAERGVEVMPFDLERTTHIFEKIDNGGLQQAISDDKDVEQVGLIRAHLAEEAKRFSQGDFHDPEMIHGENMTGLHELNIVIAEMFRPAEGGENGAVEGGVEQDPKGFRKRLFNKERSICIRFAGDVAVGNL